MPEYETKMLEPFFEPRSIAIIGASNDIRKPGGKPLNAMLNKGYKGGIYPVNPKYTSVLGVKCYPSLADIKEEVDLAVLSIPAEGVYAALKECAKKGVKGAVIFSSGFSEAGPGGVKLQEDISNLAKSTGLRLCGPNCLGVVNTVNGAAASFAFILDIPDVDPRTVGFATQSGAYGALIYAQALYCGVGLKYFVSVGNEADLEIADFLGYMVKDPAIKVLGGYLEGAKDGQKLRRVAEEAARLEKPVMIMKVGRSTAGARAASSHTGSLAGEDRIYDAFFKQTGIIRIAGYEELISFVPVVSSGRLPGGRNIAVLSTSGGAGVTLSDMCEELGLTLPRLEQGARAKMEAALPSFASAQNPIDLTAQYLTRPEMLMTCLEALLESDQIDIILGNFDLKEPYGVAIARQVIDFYNSTHKTMVICPWVFPGTDEGDGVRELRRAGVPVLLNPAQAVQALAHLADYAEYLRLRKRPEYKSCQVYQADQAPGTEQEKQDYQGRREVTSATLRRTPWLEGQVHQGQREYWEEWEHQEPRDICGQGTFQAGQAAAGLNNLEGVLSEGQSKALLSSFGIPVTREALAAGPDEAAALAAKIGYPVALKVDSPDLPHKTEAGALMLNLKSGQEVRAAYQAILHNARSYKPGARINGVLVQEMLPQGIEVIIGVTRDAVFGPTVMFGLGGIFVEVLKDVSFRVAPLTYGDALDMIKEVRGYQLLKGVRGKPPADIQALAEVIMKVSAMVTELKDSIEELDINPLVVYPESGGARAADAMVVLKKAPAENGD